MQRLLNGPDQTPSWPFRRRLRPLWVMEAAEFELSAILRFDPGELDVTAIEEQLVELPHLGGDLR